MHTRGKLFSLNLAYIYRIYFLREGLHKKEIEKIIKGKFDEIPNKMIDNGIMYHEDYHKKAFKTYIVQEDS